jgi:hypothetical protein
MLLWRSTVYDACSSPEGLDWQPDPNRLPIVAPELPYLAFIVRSCMGPEESLCNDWEYVGRGTYAILPGTWIQTYFNGPKYKSHRSGIETSFRFYKRELGVAN